MEGEVGEAKELLLDNNGDVEEPGDHCSRYSPQEVFHTDIHPRLVNILDELSHFVESVLSRIESALYTLIPHVSESPIGETSVEELFPEMRRFMFGTMRSVYDVIKTAWKDTITSHVQGHATPLYTLTSLSVLKEAQHQGQEKLVISLREMSITLKAVVFNSIHVIQTSLKLPNDTDEHEAALAINKKVPKIAPNFLGSLISMILKRGSDPSGYKKILKEPLRSIIPFVDKMYSSLEDFIRLGGEAVDMGDFWINMTQASHHHLQESPILEEDYEAIYQNEEYLTELVLELLASF
ncbi:uncharacterized protein LOC121864602 isoform X3 [Homarus americanus]|uniref:uncharacterized protein LOC121864602 isoform X2 n=1 Tax=Homarus americanus TaxID=6706 RepID=UPI001C45D226|nr:uncharacterized protein LOC121864602 isoform X2 [Homarus americanus]XP_042219612.1 uncharacterized protein LOC121864602 isoform X3 [Homarus americanus]